MIQLSACAVIADEITRKLNAFPVADRPARWNGKANAVVAFRNEISAQGAVIQENRCAWCRLPLGREGRRTIHRDHIAPKALHPVWTFLPLNLVLACEFCNGFENKSDLQTVSEVDGDYAKCKFFIVHPYLDTVADHFEYDVDEDDLPVVIKGISPEGKWTIKHLNLADPGVTKERAKEVLHKIWKEDRIKARDAVLIERAVKAI